jgi:hypothetical protein
MDPKAREVSKSRTPPPLKITHCEPIDVQVPLRSATGASAPPEIRAWHVHVDQERVGRWAVPALASMGMLLEDLADECGSGTVR